jgi:hypothetical protein
MPATFPVILISELNVAEHWQWFQMFLPYKGWKNWTKIAISFTDFLLDDSAVTGTKVYSQFT